jgi:hypothetical protein
LLAFTRSFKRCAVFMDGAASFNRRHSSASANQYSESENSISLFASSATSRHMSSSTANSSFEYMGCSPLNQKYTPIQESQTLQFRNALDTCVKAFPKISEIKCGVDPACATRTACLSVTPVFAVRIQALRRRQLPCVRSATVRDHASQTRLRDCKASRPHGSVGSSTR